MRTVVEDVMRKKGIRKVVLWGRSMGACTAVFYVHRYGADGHVCAMVLDSPFMDLRILVK